MAHKKGRKVALVAGIALVVLSVAMVWTYRDGLVAWYVLWQNFESLGKNAQGYAEYRHRQTGIVFVGIAALLKRNANGLDRFAHAAVTSHAVNRA